MDALAALQRLGGGRLMEELYQALKVTAEEVVATGKPGTVTLRLQVSNKNQGDPMVIIDEQVSRSAPKKDPRGAPFFAINGDLHKEDPRQTKMDMRIVDTETGEIRELLPTERVERIAE